MINVDLLVTSPSSQNIYRSRTKAKTKKLNIDQIEMEQEMEEDVEAKPKRTRKASTNTSKAKGNSFENKMAKLLGEWIFKDKLVLTRSLTSGAIKSVYTGDIVPQKPFGWDYFMFNFECKSGYSQHIPNFINYTKIEEWLKKCLKDRTMQQPIIWLICGFHGYETILITDLEFTLKSNLIIKVENISFYIYKLKELLKYEFYSLYGNNIKLLEVFNLPKKDLDNDK